MSVINNFIKKCKLPVLWTIGYVFITWAILHILFNFELFSTTNWIRVSHAHLRGMGGFTFCLIVFAVIPLYIATLSIVIKTQQPLLALPMPKFIAKIMERIFPRKNTETEKTEEKTENTQPTNQEIDNFPSEMRGAFIRARTRPTRINAPICSVCSVTPNVYPNNDQSPVQPSCPIDDMPLPPDFDTDDNTFSAPSESHSAPIFQDIDLYDNDSFNNESSENPVTEYLKKNNRNFNVSDNGIIITDNAAIAVHTDSDFWIMDEPIWFASGKTRESPINTLRDIAAKNNIQAILYLGETNIMNFNDKRAEWESAGIHVITKLEDL